MDATFAQNGEDLSIAIDGSNDVLTIEGWFAAGSNTFAEITFSDGTTVTPTDMADILANGGKIYVPPVEVLGTESNDRIFGTDANEIFYGFAGDDFLKGGNGNDSFVGGVGDDHLYGGAGSDTFYFNLGDQMTRVYDNAEAGQVNTVVFGAGIFRDDMEIIRNVNAIDILIKSTGDILRISSWDNTSPVDEFVFTEAGQTLTVDEINNGVQVLYGTEDTDTRLLGSTNDDEIHALGGNDTVYADAGSDTVYGGLGNDSIYGDRNAGGVELTNGGDDTLYGDAGNDRVYGGVGNDTLYGGTGVDHLYGGTGSDTFVFNIGDELNYIYDEQNASDVNTLHFGAGITAADLSFSRIGSALEIGLISTGDALRIFNWDGEPIHNFTFAEPDQTLTIADINAVLSVVNGTAGNDTLVGTSANETMYGLDGDDTLYGNLGSDSLYGGEGDDTLYGALNSAGAGGVESNFLDGGAGNDRLYGGDASDEILGGAGNDRLVGNDGDDTLSGDDGNDIVNGNDGNDVLDGGAGIDYLQGGNGDDILVYDSLDARIWGNTGNDILRLDDTQQSLNLNHSAIRYIEGVDMTNGTDENTVTLTLNDVLRVSDTAIMQVTGDEGDTVLVVDNLTRGGDVSIDGTDFASYTGNGATILIQLGLDLNEQQVIANT